MQHLKTRAACPLDGERLEGSTADEDAQAALESIGLHGGKMRRNSVAVEWARLPPDIEKMTPDAARISRTMSRVRSSGSGIERRLGSALWAAGLRYRKQCAVFGRPDFALVGKRVAIFCDSEFWHGYRWGERRKQEHKSNQAYWFAKIERNRKRDRLVNRTLRNEGWTVIRFWEREIKQDVERCVATVMTAIPTRQGRLSAAVRRSSGDEVRGLQSARPPVNPNLRTAR